VGLAPPLPDPALGIAEVLILLLLPPLVTLMAAVAVIAPPARRIWGLCAFGFTLLTAGTTAPVHLIGLLVARRLSPGPPHGSVFGWDWPGVLYAVDVTGWDLFLGLALLAAGLSLPGERERTARRLLLAAGVLSLLGLAGPAFDVISLRLIGVLGYAVVLPLGAAALGRTLLAAPGSTPGPFGPGRAPAAARSSAP